MNKLDTANFSLEGCKRQEEIILKGAHRVFPFDKALLSLGETFNPSVMYLVEALSNRELSVLQEPYSVGIIRHYSDESKNQDARAHMKIVLKDALSKIPQPKRIVAKLLTDDQHWQLLFIDLTKGIEHPEIYLVDSKNGLKFYSLYELQKEYFEKFGSVLNEIFEELGYQNRFKVDELRYIQGLQYGMMSCGIASDLNCRKISMLPEEDLQNLITQPGDVVRNEIHYSTCLENEPQTEIIYEIDKENSIDRSMRYTPLEEGARRVNIYFDLCRRERLKEELVLYVK